MVSEIVQLVTMMQRKTGQAEQYKCRSRRRADTLALAVVTMSKDGDGPNKNMQFVSRSTREEGMYRRSASWVLGGRKVLRMGRRYGVPG